jgi:hypothetical protein
VSPVNFTHFPVAIFSILGTSVIYVTQVVKVLVCLLTTDDKKIPAGWQVVNLTAVDDRLF